MDEMDRTMKLRAFSPEMRVEVAPEISAKERGLALDLEKKTAQLEEERKKGLECLGFVEKLRDILRHEQAKSAALQAQLAAAEARTRELTEVIDKISSITATATQPKQSS